MTSTSTSSRAAPTYRLPQRQPPLANKCHLHGRSPDRLSVIVSQAALHQLEVYSNSDTERELGGALLGQAYRHGERIFVEVQAILPADNHNHGPVHFTFSADSWPALQKAQAEQYPQLDMVGWFHTHPDLGVFYSSDDVVVHSAAFTLPWHVGLVLDPVRREGCFFGWQDGELATLPGFYELLDEQPESVVGWRVKVSRYASETGIYHDMPPPVPHARSRQATLTSYQWLEQYGPWPAVGGSLFLLLLFLILGLWLGNLNRQVNVLQQAVTSLAAETLQESNVAACPDPRLRLLAPVANGRISPGPISFIGTADHPDAHRYRLEGRLNGGNTWQLIQEWRRDVQLGALGQWDTSGYPAGLYEVRLIAVDNNNVRLAHTSLCQIVIELGS
jgi:proteasome lid subunit RPN8/RPN11